MVRHLSFASLTLALSIAACGGEQSPSASSPPPSGSSESASSSSSASASTATPAPSASSSTAQSAPPAPSAPTPLAKWEGFSTPESVLYDAERDRYLVANINGKPLDVDDNGFISVLSPEGTVTELKWIESGKKKVHLDAPKGMAIVKGTLYVSDITVVRMFDAKTGAPKGDIKVEGATFLNDVAAAPDGRVFVSDSGLKSGDKGFEPSGTDAVWLLEKGKAKLFAKSAELGRPNGLLVVDKSVLVVTFGSGELYRLDEKGAKQDAMKLPKGGLDGIVAMADGTLLISSWEGQAVYKGKLGGSFEVALAAQVSPADIGWDSKRSRVLVPHLMGTTVEAHAIQ